MSNKSTPPDVSTDDGETGSTAVRCPPEVQAYLEIIISEVDDVETVDDSLDVILPAEDGHEKLSYGDGWINISPTLRSRLTDLAGERVTQYQVISHYAKKYIRNNIEE